MRIKMFALPRTGQQLLKPRRHRAIVDKTVGKEIAKTINLSLPIIAAQLAQMALGFIDTVMAGNLSAIDLAAVAIGRSLFMPGFIFVLGVLLAVNPIVAQFYGAGEVEKIGKTVRQALWLSLLIAVPGFFVLRNLQYVMRFMNLPPEVIPITSGYLDALSWCLPAVFAYLVLRFFNDGISVSKPHMYFAMAAIPLNVLGNYTFMYGKFGFPKMGAVGAGWATSLVWWILLGAMVLLTIRGKTYQRYSIYHRLKLPDWHYFREILQVGVPNGVSLAMEIGMFAIVALIIGSLGVSVVAGHQIAINFASITFMVPLGISIAATSRVGFTVGEQKITRLRLTGNIAIGLSLLASAVTAIAMMTIPEWIVAIYTDENGVARVAVNLLFMAALFQLSDGLQVSASGALRGLKDTKIPMMVNIVAYWGIGLMSGYYLGIVRKHGAVGLWIGLIAGLSMAAVSHTSRFYYLTARKRHHRYLKQR